LDRIFYFVVKWQPLAVFISACATAILAFLVVYQDRLRARAFRPKLDLEQGPFYPDFDAVPVIDEMTKNPLGEACYLQIRVKNYGCSPAKMVEVFIAKLEKEINGVFREVDGFYPLNLKWRHYDKVFLDRIPPDTGRDCTLGRIVNPEQKGEVGDDDPSLELPDGRSPFRLELAIKPTTRSDLLRPGKYRLLLEISASNAMHPKKRTIELEFTGEWLPETKNMVKAKPI